MENINLRALLDSSKDQLDTLIDVLSNEAESDELNAYIIAKKLEYVSKSLIEILHDRAFDEAERNKNSVVKSAEISVKETGVRYDYSKCNYAPYNNLMNQKKSIETELKTFESLLKAISKPQTIVDDVTGEVVDVKPPQKVSKTSIIISLK